MSACGALWALALGAACAYAQTVEGSVVNSLTGEGIAGVEVELQQSFKKVYAATSDARGQFRIDEMKDGAYTAHYISPGYWLANPGSGSDGTRPFQVAAGGNPVKITARLMPLGKITGRVVDGKGKGIADAQLELTSPGFAVFQSDAGGRFELDELFPGSYTLSVIPPPGLKPPDADPESDRVWNWTRTYYPGVTLREAAAPIVLAAGAEVPDIELKLQAAGAHAIRGVLLNPDGKPVPKVTVKLGEDTLLPPEYHVESRADGTFEFPAVVDGEWRLSAVADGSGGLKWWASQWIEMAGHAMEGVKLRLDPPFTLRGTVVLETPQGVPPPTPPAVSLDAHVSRIRRENIPLYMGMSPFALGMPMHPDGAGDFELPVCLSRRLPDPSGGPAGHLLSGFRAGGGGGAFDAGGGDIRAAHHHPHLQDQRRHGAGIGSELHVRASAAGSPGRGPAAAGILPLGAVRWTRGAWAV